MRRTRVGAALLTLAVLATTPACRPRPSDGLPSALTVLVPALPVAIDPFQDLPSAGDIIFCNVFQPLLRLGPLGVLEPVLAESWASKPGELTVQLKAGIRLHDGSLLDASQVVASLDAARQPGSRFAVRFANVTEVRANGSRSVLLGAAGGAVLAPQLLADVPIRGPRPANGLPPGSGPYRIGTFTPGELTILEATAAEAGGPQLTHVTIRRFRSSEEIQVAIGGFEPPLVLGAPADVALVNSSDAYRVVREPGTSVLSLFLDVARDPTPGIGLPKNPLRNASVRQALRRTLERGKLQASLPGGSTISTELVPPASFGFDPAIEVPAASIDEAKALLRAAGLATGFDVRLDLGLEQEALGHALAAQLETVGIRAKLNPLRPEALRTVMQNESSLALAAWTPGPDAAFGLRQRVHSRREPGLGQENGTGYSDADVDRQIEAALAASDPGARKAALQATLGKLSQDSAWIPLLIPTTVSVLPRGLTYPARLDGAVMLAEAHLEPPPSPTPRPSGLRRPRTTP
jgi:peptide/nickel transport system substrate-binding protein